MLVRDISEVALSLQRSHNADPALSQQGSWHHPSPATGSPPLLSALQGRSPPPLLLLLLPAARGRYCSAKRQLPGVTALDQLLTWHKPGWRKVENVLKGEKNQEEGDSNLAKCPNWERRERELNLGGSPWGRAPTSHSTVRGGYLSFVRTVLGPEKGR